MSPNSTRKLLSLAPVLICIFSLIVPLHFAAAEPHTAFQSSADWKPELHIPIDLAMVYSTNPERIKTWADRGFETWTMIGASWLGKNNDIVVENPEIVQMSRGGVNFEMIPGRAWVVPVGPWIEYTKGRVAQAIEVGAKGILPEEPEFFASTGYSESFKEAWKNFYGEEWQAPYSSATAQWRASRLKAHLFTEFYREVFKHVKKIDPNVKCLIPAHSNPNYADWKIVAPHHAFMSLDETDGFVGQVWTGTAKHRHFLGGASYASVFDFSFLEYSYFAELVAGTGKEVWFLTDPVEDAKGAAWEDLRDWYEQTLVAALLQPGVNKYECVPWPRRVFTSSDLYGGSPIPDEYATELLSVWAAQRKIPAEGNFIEPVNTEIGFLTSDTLMWQREVGLDRFHGFIAPMLAAVKSGVFVRVLPAERFPEPGYPPADIKLIVASFDAWKPAKREIVDAIAAWVKRGGTLLFIGGADDYDDVEGAWWKETGLKSPFDALLSSLSLEVRRSKAYKPTLNDKIFTTATQFKTIETLPEAPEMLQQVAKAASPMPISSYDVAESRVQMTVGKKKRPLMWEADAGEGIIVYAGFPGEFVAIKAEGIQVFFNLLSYAMTHAGIELKQPRAFLMRRGPFVVGRGISERVSVDGRFIDLLNPGKSFIKDFGLKPGANAFLLDVDKATRQCGDQFACIVHASGNVLHEDLEESEFNFSLSGPKDRMGYAWVQIKGDLDIERVAHQNNKILWDMESNLLFIEIPVSPDGTSVKITTDLHPSMDRSRALMDSMTKGKTIFVGVEKK